MSFVKKPARRSRKWGLPDILGLWDRWLKGPVKWKVSNKKTAGNTRYWEDPNFGGAKKVSQQVQAPSMRSGSHRNYRDGSAGGHIKSYGRKRRRFKRYGSSKRRRISYAIKKYVNSRIKAPDATNIYRTIDSGAITSAVNSQSWTSFALMGRAALDTALGASEHYEDNGAGAITVVPTDIGDNASTSFKVRIVKAYVRYTFRNNGSHPCDVHAYKMFCKSNTSLLPTAMLSLAVAEKGIAASITSPLVSLYDGNCTTGWKRDWKIAKYMHYRLNPGDECVMYLKRKKPFFHEANQEDDDEEYLRGVTQLLVINLRGCIVHSDADDSKVGTDEAQIDWVNETGIKFGALPATHYTRVIDSGEYDTFADGVAMVPENEHIGFET